MKKKKLINKARFNKREREREKVLLQRDQFSFQRGSSEAERKRKRERGWRKMENKRRETPSPISVINGLRI